jgi:acetolactate decarboxylase
MTPDHEMLFQVSTLPALLEGLFDGTLTFGELESHGDFGLGTFHALDGEMVAIDGDFYRVRANGRTSVAAGTETTPFAVVTRFRPDTTFEINETLDFAALEVLLDRHVSQNLPYAVRVDGYFPAVRVRSVPRQEKPYPRLSTVTATQPTWELQNRRGTLVGFRFPGYMGAVNLPGYHFHFLTNDRRAGGHVLALSTTQGTVSLQELGDFYLHLPRDSSFRMLQFPKDSTEEARRVER